ncbi:hypothetical protein [Clostridium fungisolvens]|uniref:Uncharacterized protein n=1 Tax=Clostridium fungisolvens TaxID=1604897 RepID=A0A6V8SAG3_9CLOT|nr:hypothetical protein [Clostridium fungisolvens]GFP74244.1 hypothetical protein bsdtw1_00289 [Clostridium fungisolvens]
MARKRKSKDFVIGPDDLGYEEEEVDMNGFVDFEDGQHIKPNEVLVARFNFFDDNSENITSSDTHSTLDASKDKTIIKEADENKATDTSTQAKKNIVDIRTTKISANGVTPPVDGEFFTIKRTYTLRKSTVKMLNHIKALDDDINVYMNTLVDDAIRYYYDHILNKSKNV